MIYAPANSGVSCVREVSVKFEAAHTTFSIAPIGTQHAAEAKDGPTGSEGEICVK